MSLCCDSSEPNPRRKAEDIIDVGLLQMTRGYTGPLKRRIAVNPLIYDMRSSFRISRKGMVAPVKLLPQ